MIIILHFKMVHVFRTLDYFSLSINEMVDVYVVH